MQVTNQLLDYNLADLPPQKSYPFLKLDSHKLFAGYLIKNQYDEQRLKICKTYDPVRFSFLTNTGDYKMYGILRDTQAPFMQQLAEKKISNLVEYNSLLTLEGMSCYNCFLHFAPGLYPIDSVYLNRFFPEVDFSNFNNKRNISTFQKMSHIYLFTLIKI